MEALQPKLVICRHLHKAYTNTVDVGDGHAVKICALADIQQGEDSVAIQYKGRRKDRFCEMRGPAAQALDNLDLPTQETSRATGQNKATVPLLQKRSAPDARRAIRKRPKKSGDGPRQPGTFSSEEAHGIL
jgi:hypothetical protein